MAIKDFFPWNPSPLHQWFMEQTSGKTEHTVQVERVAKLMQEAGMVKFTKGPRVILSDLKKDLEKAENPDARIRKHLKSMKNTTPSPLSQFQQPQPMYQAYPATGPTIGMTFYGTSSGNMIR